MVGDVLVDRDDPDAAFALVHDCLNDGELLFGNCETAYSDTLERPPATFYSVTSPPTNVVALEHVGFDVMACANNHILDGGHAGMFETRRHLREHGVAPVGVGASEAEAWEPVVAIAGGLRVAFVAFASMFPHGGEARGDWPGMAAVRGHNVYLDPIPNNWTPGAIPQVTSYPNRHDVAMLERSIEAAKAAADLVVVSAHWGDWTRSGVLTDHELELARVAIDAGADIVAGHHHHLLRGVEWYRGKPILYGLGHFIFDLQRLIEFMGHDAFPTIADPDDDDYHGVAHRPGWPLLPLHPDSRMTVVAWAEIDADRACRVGVLPCLLNPEGQAVPYAADSPEGARVIEYLMWTCEVAGLATAARPSNVTLGGLATVELVPSES